MINSWVYVIRIYLGICHPWSCRRLACLGWPCIPSCSKHSPVQSSYPAQIHPCRLYTDPFRYRRCTNYNISGTRLPWERNTPTRIPRTRSRPHHMLCTHTFQRHTCHPQGWSPARSWARNKTILISWWSSQELIVYKTTYHSVEEVGSYIYKLKEKEDLMIRILSASIQGKPLARHRWCKRCKWRWSLVRWSSSLMNVNKSMR